MKDSELARRRHAMIRRAADMLLAEPQDDDRVVRRDDDEDVDQYGGNGGARNDNGQFVRRKEDDDAQKAPFAGKGGEKRPVSPRPPLPHDRDPKDVEVPSPSPEHDPKAFQKKSDLDMVAEPKGEHKDVPQGLTLNKDYEKEIQHWNSDDKSDDAASDAPSSPAKTDNKDDDGGSSHGSDGSDGGSSSVAECDDRKKESSDDYEAARMEALRSELTNLRAQRAARLMRKAKSLLDDPQDNVSDDLKGPDGDSSHIEKLRSSEVSDDLVKAKGKGDSAKNDAMQQKTDATGAPESLSKSVKASHNVAASFAAAYRLIDAQRAQGVISASVDRNKCAATYVAQYDRAAMEMCADNLERVGSMGKRGSDEPVRVARRMQTMPAVTASMGSSMDSEILFR